MRTSRLVTVAAALGSYVWVLAGGCSSADDSPPGAGAGTGSSPTMDASSDATTIMPDAMGLGGSNGVHLNPLCGEAPAEEQCVPDDLTACADFRPPVIKPPTGSGGEGGGGGRGHGEDGQGGEGGQGDLTTGGEGFGGGAAGESGGEGGLNAGGAVAGGGEGGGAGASGEPLEPARYGCQITRVDSVTGRSCQLAGEGELNAPCFSGQDCRAGLACVTQGEGGRCLRYCCSGDGNCDKGSYCAEQLLRNASSDTTTSEPLRVPVCVPADDCSLEEPFPCPEGTECRCKDDTACLVVRDDGTTTCRTPGKGQQGEPCACAWNHVCSSVTNTCVKICNTDPAKDDCGEQRCQASSELPQNFGVCVGPVR
ncbi:MAG TPA: hypothetical protein VEX18_06180 [Polyangiaceae bacterium]|nr:hypothetical protein [Polyangiaceae bacterium]